MVLYVFILTEVFLTTNYQVNQKMCFKKLKDFYGNSTDISNFHNKLHRSHYLETKIPQKQQQKFIVLQKIYLDFS